jgi:hypothetical protein
LKPLFVYARLSGDTEKASELRTRPRLYLLVQQGSAHAFAFGTIKLTAEGCGTKMTHYVNCENWIFPSLALAIGSGRFDI